MKKILLTDGSYKHTLGMLISLRNQGYIVDFVGNRRSICNFAPGPGCLLVHDNEFTVSNSKKFIDKLIKGKVDAIIPVGAASVETLSLIRSELPKGIKYELTSHENIKLCLDKRSTLTLAKKLGLLVPETFEIYSLDDLNNIDENMFPLVIKGYDETNKFGPFYCLNPKEAINILSKYDFSSSVLAQKQIFGEGYGFFALYRQGELVDFYCHKRLREYPPSGGVSVCAETVYDQQLYENGKRLLDSLGWHGVAMVEFKKDTLSGKFILMEINPKFWGSHDLALAAGVNFPLTLLSLDADNYITHDLENINYPVGVKYQWPLHGDIQSMFANHLRLKHVLIDLFSFAVHKNIYWKSPRLLLSQLNEFAFSLLSNLKLIQSLRKFTWRCRKIGIKFSLLRMLTECTGVPILKYCEVEPGLSVGMQHSKLGLFFLKMNGYTACLSLRFNNSDKGMGLSFLVQKQIPVREYFPPSLDQLKSGVKFIAERRSLNNSIYIHCREGVSRAPLFLAAYLISSEKCSAELAVSKIKRVRPFVNILPSQMDVLKQFEENILRGLSC